MTSQLSQTDVASFDRDVVEMKKTDGNPHSHAAPSDMGEKPASSPAAVEQFDADWSRFEDVFARGLLSESWNNPGHILI